MVEEAGREAHLSAQQPAPCQAARVPPSHGDARRSGRGPGSSAQGPSAPVGLIWRIRDRRTFLELRRSGTRARRGPVTVIHLAANPYAPAQPPRIAFAVPRKVGTAVVRNRIRRCVRGRLLQRVRDPHRGVAPGAYLVTVRAEAAGLDGADVADLVDACLDRLEQRT